MVRFSIVVPVYKSEAYLPQCLSSLQKQGFSDWEAVIVVDGSPDRCLSIAKEYSAVDSRFKVIEKQENEGTHLARRSGVLSASGEYILFLDSDDTLPQFALLRLDEELANRPAQVLHYGIKVIDAGVDSNEMRMFEEYINRETEIQTGREVLDIAFSEKCGYRQDWRVTQRVYDRDFLQRAFRAMTQDRLGRAQDAYEYFVIACLAEEQTTNNALIGLNYYYGRGLNGSSALSIESFIKSVKDFQCSISAIEKFCGEVNDATLFEPCSGAKNKLLQLLMNDWLNRVEDQDKLEAADQAMHLLGVEEVAFELKRFVRDEAYDIWRDKGGYTATEPLHLWNEFANEATSHIDLSDRYKDMNMQANSHLSDLMEYKKLKERYAKQDIRIFVASHKKVDLFESEILQPIQVGARAADELFPNMLKDHDGMNISFLNPFYCELTAQYWAWKNVDAEYYGFCHYRRYFNFSDNYYEENAYGEIIDGVINKQSQKKYALDDASIQNAVDGYDVIVTEIKDLRKMGGGFQTPLEQYQEAPLLYEDDLFTALSILCESHPEYKQDVESFIKGNYSCFCNMYVMKKEIFFAYCEWLFPLLEKFCEARDMSYYSKEALRTPGHLSERLFNIYLNHHIRTGTNWKMKQVQCVHFEHPEKHYPLEKMSEEAIPVVFAADDSYAPMVATTIRSMLDNASNEYDYDIFILSNGISLRNQDKMRSELREGNVSLRFIDAMSLIDSYNLSTNNAHIGIETYFRFLIQDVLKMYDKVLYLDSDLIVRADVSELYSVDLGGNLIAAVSDIDFLGNLNMKDEKRLKYNQETLKMSNPYDYFQAGVLVMNTKAFRESCSVSFWLDLASNDSYIYNDQDILNSICEGKVVYLDPRWNVMNNCGNRIANVFSVAPAAVFDEYLAAREDPWIIHYAGCEKPWKDWDCDLREVYWQYARKTSFYEDLLGILLRQKSGGNRDGLLSKENLKKIANPILPIGSQRREVVKKIARKILK